MRLGSRRRRANTDVVAYTIAGAIGTNVYVLTATAAGPQATDLCGNLTLDQTGARTHTAGDDADCSWGTGP